MDNTIQVLVVEDDADIQELICHHLEKEGFSTIRVSDGQSALNYVKDHFVDVILLDLNLPKVSGIEVLKTIRYSYQMNTHIIIVSARTDETDIITALELGADNYLPKPFSPKVLVASVKALFRRSRGMKESSVEEKDKHIVIGSLSIDLLRYEVMFEGRVIALSVTEFSLLTFLASFPGRVFTRNQIITELKGDDYPVTQRSIDVQIASLRRKLKEAGELIQTVWGIGYSFQDKVL
ncbi:MAG: response regulator transcription factor [Spirochaetia bacterium]|nr:response regulator transcription factor [Spirochaetia bacterium]